jgi:hypothetical protein
MPEPGYKKLNDWKGSIIPALPGIFRMREQQGRAKLTLRGLYYLLWKAGIIKKSKGEVEAELRAAETGERVKQKDSLYTNLGENVSDARLDPNYSVKYAIPLDALRDDSKPISDEPPTRTAKEEAQLTKRYITKETWGNFYTPSKWNGQDVYIEVWIEKSTIFEDINQIVNDELDWQARVVSNGGNVGTSHLHEAYLRLWRKQYLEDKKVYIFYLGDYDAYGTDMDRDIRKRLFEIKLRYATTRETTKVDLGDKYQLIVPLLDLHNGDIKSDPDFYRIGGDKGNDGGDMSDSYTYFMVWKEGDNPTHIFQRIGITKSQITELRLTKIDERRIRDEDLRSSAWAKQYPAEYQFAIHNGGRIFNVEIDDMVANNWDQLSQLLNEKIDDKFDEDKAEEARDENSLEAYDKEMEKMLHEFCEQWMKDKKKRNKKRQG